MSGPDDRERREAWLAPHLEAIERILDATPRDKLEEGETVIIEGYHRAMEAEAVHHKAKRLALIGLLAELRAGFPTHRSWTQWEQQVARSLDDLIGGAPE